MAQGKTTILKTIMGLLEDQPDKGTIEFLGKRIDGKDAEEIVHLGISYVPEGREVFPELSVDENLRMGAYTRKDKKGSEGRLRSGDHPFPCSSPEEESMGWHIKRRRAADARHRQGTDDETQTPDDG